MNARVYMVPNGSGGTRMRIKHYSEPHNSEHLQIIAATIRLPRSARIFVGAVVIPLLERNVVIPKARSMNKLHKSESINHYSAPIDFSTSFRRFTLSPTVYSHCRIRFLTRAEVCFFFSRSSDFPLRTNKAVFSSIFIHGFIIWLSICMHSPFFPFFILSLSFSVFSRSGKWNNRCRLSI